MPSDIEQFCDYLQSLGAILLLVAPFVIGSVCGQYRDEHLSETNND